MAELNDSSKTKPRKKVTKPKADLESLLTQIEKIVATVEHVETHLQSAMDQFKYLGERYHDNIKYQRKLEVRLDNLSKRMEKLLPDYEHCKKCHRILKANSKKCGICGESK